MLLGLGASAKGSDLRRKKGGHPFFRDEKEVSVLGGGGWDQRLQTLRSVCRMEFPRCLQAKEWLVSFLRENVARLETKVSPFTTQEACAVHLPVYQLGPREQSQGAR